MNWADLSFVATPLVCALGAGAAAADEKMGLSSLLFGLGGLAIGLPCGALARRLGIMLLFAGGREARPVVTLGLLIAYLLVPMAVMFGSFGACALLAKWIAALFT